MKGPETGFAKVHEHQIHQGHIVRLTASTFRGPGGEEFTRDVVHTPDAVGIVAVDRNDAGAWEVVLVGQFRAAVEGTVLEIPAGMCDVEGESPEQTAQRELMEEAGYRAHRIEPLIVFHPAPGFTTHRTTVVLGRGLDEVERAADGIEERHMTIERLLLADALSLIGRGEITDAKTVIGLLLARDHLED